MKKLLIFLLMSLLLVTLLTSCRDDPEETAWYKDWLNGGKLWGTTAPEETTAEPEETTTEPEDVTTPEETVVEPEETTEPETSPEETTEPETSPEETTVPETSPSYEWGDIWGDTPFEDTTVTPDDTPVTPEDTTVTPEDTTVAPEDTTETPDVPTAPEEEDTTAPEVVVPQPEEYIISYITNGGVLPSNAAHRFTSETEVVLPTPTKNGYSFKGWYENENFSGNAVTVITQGTTGDKVFYAKWLFDESSNGGLMFPIIPLPSGSDK